MSTPVWFPDLARRAEQEERDREEWLKDVKTRLRLVSIDDVTAYCAPGMSGLVRGILDLGRIRYGKIVETSLLPEDHEILIARDPGFMTIRTQPWDWSHDNFRLYQVPFWRVSGIVPLNPPPLIPLLAGI